MRKILICFGLTLGVSYAQLTYTIEKRPYKDGDAYSGWVEQIPNQDKMIFGNSYIDKEGNLLGDIPNITGGNFNYTSKGCYITYRPDKNSYNSKTVFISNERLNSISDITVEPEIVIDNKKKPSRKIVKESECYKTYGFGIFTQPGTQYEMVYLDQSFVHILSGNAVTKSVEVYYPGKRMSYYFYQQSFYGLYASDNTLTMLKVNLEDGKQDIKVLKDKHKNYSGGEFKIVGDKIYLVSFYGDCSYNFMANTQITKGDGIICMTINANDLSVESETETALPEDYQKLFNLSNNKVTDPKVITMHQNGKDFYVITSNGTGNIGSQTTVVAPMLVWKLEEDGLALIGSLGGAKSTYPSTATFLSYNDRNYLLYCCTYTYDSYKQNINLVDITDGMSEDSKVHTLDLNTENIDFYFYGASNSYLTPTGKLIFVGKGKNYQSVLYVKIDLPS